MWAPSLAVNIAAVSALVPRQLTGPSTASAVVTQPTSLAVSNVSADAVAYSGDVETYYLGYRDWDEESYLMHQVPNGYRELRARFWIAEKNHGSAQLGHDLAVHCNIEMTHLGAFLSAIFEEFKNEV